VIVGANGTPREIPERTLIMASFARTPYRMRADQITVAKEEAGDPRGSDPRAWDADSRRADLVVVYCTWFDGVSSRHACVYYLNIGGGLFDRKDWQSLTPAMQEAVRSA
jgi:hypothetical protein